MNISKLLISSAITLSLAAGSAFADSVYITEAPGTTNESVNITQTASLSNSNYANFTQGDVIGTTTMSGTVIQDGGGIGGDSTAVVDQGTGTGYADNDTAYLYQNGSGNGATILQGINAPSINDTAQIYQGYSGTATGDTAVITQGLSAESAGNTDTILQGYDGTATNDTATISVDGNFLGTSTATIYQGVYGTSSGDQAYITQSGGNNTAQINQGYAGASSGDYASITQSGGNYATVDQLGSGKTLTLVQSAGSAPVTIVQH